MKNTNDQKQVKKGFFARVIDKLDKKIEEKAKSGCCCNGQNNKGKKSCCS